MRTNLKFVEAERRRIYGIWRGDRILNVTKVNFYILNAIVSFIPAIIILEFESQTITTPPPL